MYSFFLSIANPIGIIGVVIVLIAYYLLSVGIWSAENFYYQFINFLGAWLILFSLFFYWNLSSVIIEVAWIFISMIGMYRCYLSFKKKKMNSF